MPADRPMLKFETAAEVALWFEEDGAQSDGVMILFAKKASSVRTATYGEVLDIALAHGWIDSQVRAFDDDCYLQVFTPRRARSPWSKVNREKAEAMIAAGTMKTGGIAAIEVAKANGRWDAAYAGSAVSETPQDFLDALATNPKAAAFFETLTRQNKYAVYFRLNDAKKPETRTRRIAKFVDMFERGEKFY